MIAATGCQTARGGLNEGTLYEQGVQGLISKPPLALWPLWCASDLRLGLRTCLSIAELGHGVPTRSTSAFRGIELRYESLGIGIGRWHYSGLKVLCNEFSCRLVL